MAQKHRHIALRHVLNAVDTAPANTYLDNVPRNRLYGRLIREHKLKDPSKLYDPHGNSSMNLERYRDLVKQLLASDGVTVGQFFREGSKAFAREVLKKMAYTAPAQTPKTLRSSGDASRLQGSTVGNPEVLEDEATSAEAQPEYSAPTERTSSTVRLSSGHAKRDDSSINYPDVATRNLASNPLAASNLRPNAVNVDEQVRNWSGRSLRVEVRASVARPSISPLSEAYAPSQSGDSEISARGNRTEADNKRKRVSGQREVANKAPPAKVSRRAQSLVQPAQQSGTQPALQKTRPDQEKVVSSRSSAPAQVTGQVPKSTGKTLSAKDAAAVSIAQPTKQYQAATASKKRAEIPEQTDQDVESIPVHPALRKSATDTQPVPSEASVDANAATQSRAKKALTQLLHEDPLGAQGHNLLSLGSDELGGHLRSIWSEVQTSALYLLGGLQDSDPLPAMFMESPQPELAALYSRLLGKDWRKQTTILGLIEGMTSNCLLEGLIGAAIYDWVYTAPTAWESPKELLQKLQAQHHFVSLNAYFEFIGKPNASMQEAAWRAGLDQANRPAFQQSVLRPIAQDLAAKLWNVIQPQLAVLGVRKISIEKAERNYQLRLKMFTGIFEEALILKAKTKAAPGGFAGVWVQPGSRFERTKMEDLQGGEGEREVLWCVSPRVTFREPTGGPSVTYCEAKVFARKARA